MPGVVMNAAFWRERAEEWRAVANDTLDPDEKRLLLELVADYERLAERAAKREDNQS
jgi:hypothetical protein